MVELPHRDVPTTQAVQARDDRRAGYSVWAEEGISPWAGFTGGLMVLVGVFQIIAGIVALAGTGYYTVPSRELVVDAGYTTWGWVHLILGIVLIATGAGLAFGNTVARVAGVAVAGLSAIVNLLWIPAAPVAATLVIALDVWLIFAITVHGGEPKQPR
jgi:hypothetical protein